MASTYLTVAEAAQRLDVSRTTVWRWIRQGRLRAYRVGQRTIRIRDEDLDAQITPIQQRGGLGLKAGKEDTWADYDPVKAKEALQGMRGILKGVDVEQLKKDLREARGHYDERNTPDIWAEYDAQKVRETLRRGFGILKGIDVEQMKKDIREGRAQDSKGRPA